MSYKRRCIQRSEKQKVTYLVGSLLWILFLYMLDLLVHLQGASDSAVAIYERKITSNETVWFVRICDVLYDIHNEIF